MPSFGRLDGRPHMARRVCGCDQNQSLLYATHQLAKAMGIVASRAHQMGNIKSAIRPSTVKTIQNTFRSISAF